MTGLYLTLTAVAVATLGTLFFSSLTYSLRDFSRIRLETFLEARGRQNWLEPTLDHSDDLIFVTALARLFCNLVILVGVVSLLGTTHLSEPWVYLLALAITGIVTAVCSVALPHALSRYAAESLIGNFVRFLHFWRVLFSPATRIMHAIDELVRRAVGAAYETQPEQIEQDILSVVEEGEKEGVVDEQEREMIESVIEFRDTTVGQIMTARPDIIALEAGSSLEQIKQIIEETGHSRLPVFEETLDHVVGVLYARDLLKHLGKPPDGFDMRSAVRPAFYVPESKTLRDLLRDFRQQKVHMAIVLDEYGGTAGLVTIEDVLEELVGEISDEHEPAEPDFLHRVNDTTYEADARLAVHELNRDLNLSIPEDAGYETLGGFVSTTLGVIPDPGTTFEHSGARFTVLEAEPQRVTRVRIELAPTGA